VLEQLELPYQLVGATVAPQLAMEAFN